MKHDPTCKHLYGCLKVIWLQLLLEKKKILICFDCENGLQMHRNSV